MGFDRGRSKITGFRTLPRRRLLVLDTDHVSALSFPSQESLHLLERIRGSGQEAATTIVTVEERLRGWLAEIHGHTDPHRQILAYERSLKGVCER